MTAAVLMALVVVLHFAFLKMNGGTVGARPHTSKLKEMKEMGESGDKVETGGAVIESV